MGQYVAVAYESEWLVMEKVNENLNIDLMKKISTGNDFKWPAKEDTSCVRKELIFQNKFWRSHQTLICQNLAYRGVPRNSD